MEVDRGMGGAQRVDQRRQVLAQVTAGAEEERNDVDPRRARADEPGRGVAERRRHQLEEGEGDAAVRRGGADARGDRLERLGPARIARAVGEEDDGAGHDGGR